MWSDGGDDIVYATYPDPAMEIWCGGGIDQVVFNAPSPGVATHNCEDVQVIPAG